MALNEVTKGRAFANRFIGRTFALANGAWSVSSTGVVTSNGENINGRSSGILKLPITVVANNTEHSFGAAGLLPTNAVVTDCYINVKTAEATGGTKTISIGTLSSESGGVAAGFLNGASTATLGLVRSTITTASHLVSATTRGASLATFDATTPGVYVETPYIVGSTVVGGRHVSYTLGSNDWVEFVGTAYVMYFTLA